MAAQGRPALPREGLPLLRRERGGVISWRSTRRASPVQSSVVLGGGISRGPFRTIWELLSVMENSRLLISTMSARSSAISSVMRTARVLDLFIPYESVGDGLFNAPLW